MSWFNNLSSYVRYGSGDSAKYQDIAALSATSEYSAGQRIKLSQSTDAGIPDCFHGATLVVKKYNASEKSYLVEIRRAGGHKPILCNVVHVLNNGEKARPNRQVLVTAMCCALTAKWGAVQYNKLRVTHDKVEVTRGNTTTELDSDVALGENYKNKVQFKSIQTSFSEYPKSVAEYRPSELMVAMHRLMFGGKNEACVVERSAEIGAPGDYEGAYDGFERRESPCASIRSAHPLFAPIAPVAESIVRPESHGKLSTLYGEILFSLSSVAKWRRQFYANTIALGNLCNALLTQEMTALQGMREFERICQSINSGSYGTASVRQFAQRLGLIVRELFEESEGAKCQAIARQYFDPVGSDKLHQFLCRNMGQAIAAPGFFGFPYFAFSYDGYAGDVNRQIDTLDSLEKTSRLFVTVANTYRAKIAGLFSVPLGMELYRAARDGHLGVDNLNAILAKHLNRDEWRQLVMFLQLLKDIEQAQSGNSEQLDITDSTRFLFAGLKIFCEGAKSMSPYGTIYTDAFYGDGEIAAIGRALVWYSDQLLVEI